MAVRLHKLPDLPCLACPMAGIALGSCCCCVCHQQRTQLCCRGDPCHAPAIGVMKVLVPPSRDCYAIEGVTCVWVRAVILGMPFEHLATARGTRLALLRRRPACSFPRRHSGAAVVVVRLVGNGVVVHCPDTQQLTEPQILQFQRPAGRGSAPS